MRWDLILIIPDRGINPNEEEVQDIINENDVDGSGKVGNFLDIFGKKYFSRPGWINLIILF